MIRVPRGARVWVRATPTDMRKGFAGLAALVENEMQQDLVTGDLFVFMSKDRKLAKVLAWDGTGLVLVAKRLAEGRFPNLWRYRRGEVLALPPSALRELLQGIDVTRSSWWRNRR